MSDYLNLSLDRTYGSSVRLQVSSYGPSQFQGGETYTQTRVWFRVNGKERNEVMREYLERFVRAIGGISIEENVSVSEMSGYNRKYYIVFYTFDNRKVLENKKFLEDNTTTKRWRGGRHYGYGYNDDNYDIIHNFVDVHEDGITDSFINENFSRICNAMLSICHQIVR